MPYDLLQMKKYTVPFDKLHKLLLNAGLFGDSAFEKKYFDAWFDLLKTAEYKPAYATRYFTPYRSDPLYAFCENFQIPLNYGIPGQFIEVLLHFNIQNALGFCIKNKSEVPVQQIPIDYFTGNKQNIGWTPTVGSDSYSQDRPIIMVPLVHGPYPYLVIDGNHRITEAVSSGSPALKVQIISEQDIMKEDIAGSPFDSTLYAFQNDMTTLMELYRRGNDSEALDKLSYLNTGNVITFSSLRL